MHPPIHHIVMGWQTLHELTLRSHLNYREGFYQKGASIMHITVWVVNNSIVTLIRFLEMMSQNTSIRTEVLCWQSVKVCLNRYSWGAGKVCSEYSSWFIWLECISWRFLMQIGLKMEAGDCPTLNMNAMENYLLSQSLTELLVVINSVLHEM